MVWTAGCGLDTVNENAACNALQVNEAFAWDAPLTVPRALDVLTTVDTAAHLAFGLLPTRHRDRIHKLHPVREPSSGYIRR